MSTPPKPFFATVAAINMVTPHVIRRDEIDAELVQFGNIRAGFVDQIRQLDEYITALLDERGALPLAHTDAPTIVMTPVPAAPQASAAPVTTVTQPDPAPAAQAADTSATTPTADATASAAAPAQPAQPQNPAQPDASATAAPAVPTAPTAVQATVAAPVVPANAAAAPATASSTPQSSNKVWNFIKSNSQPIVGGAILFGVGLAILILAISFIPNIHGGLVAVLVVFMLVLTGIGVSHGLTKKQKALNSITNPTP